MTTDHSGNILQDNRTEFCWIVHQGLVDKKSPDSQILYQNNSPFSSLCSSSFSTGSQLAFTDSQKSLLLRKFHEN